MNLPEHAPAIKLAQVQVDLWKWVGPKKGFWIWQTPKLLWQRHYCAEDLSAVELRSDILAEVSLLKGWPSMKIRRYILKIWLRLACFLFWHLQQMSSNKRRKCSFLAIICSMVSLPAAWCHFQLSVVAFSCTGAGEKAFLLALQQSVALCPTQVPFMTTAFWQSALPKEAHHHCPPR